MKRWFRNGDVDTPVRLHCLMPTVPKALQRSLDAQPVMLLGERWTVPKPKPAATRIKSYTWTTTCVDPGFWMSPPVQRLDREQRRPVDFEQLPAA